MSKSKKKSPFYLTCEMAQRFELSGIKVYLNNTQVNECIRFKSGTNGFIECFTQPHSYNYVNDSFKTKIRRGKVTFKLSKK